MTIFEFISVAISIILGLSIARLLTGAIDLISHRERIQFHWVPIVWASIMFSLLILFWWQLFGSNQFLKQWAFWDFLLAISCTVCIYVACGLILPRRWTNDKIDLLQYFEKDGRFGVAAYSLFYLIVIPYNMRLYGEMATAGVLTMNLIQAVLAGVAAFNRSKRWLAMSTIAFVVIYLSNVAVVIFPAFGQ